MSDIVVLRQADEISLNSLCEDTNDFSFSTYNWICVPLSDHERDHFIHSGIQRKKSHTLRLKKSISQLFKK